MFDSPAVVARGGLVVALRSSRLGCRHHNAASDVSDKGYEVSGDGNNML